MKHRKILLLFLLLMAIFVVGCKETPEATPEPKPPAEEQQGDKTGAIQEEWSKSKHAVATDADSSDSPAKRDNCLLCHDGRAYAQQISSAADLDTEKSVGQDCETCHEGHGKEVWESGLVTLPAGEVKDGGGALCMDCHNARKTPEPANFVSPHYSTQGDIVMGTNGFHVEGKNYGTSPHTGVQDTCFGCHMADLGGGYPSHTFISEIETCEPCHKGIETLNLKAKADYDGNGTAEGFQDEVEGLQKLLKETVAAKLQGGTFTSTHGKIVFRDQDEQEITDVPEELYHAAWNYYLTDNDGSKGLHNPTYVVQLLQQSILMLDGDLHDAEEL